jgi:hypothetical protein
MLDRILNPTPTFYKWDKFWVGFVPALLLPPLAFIFFYLLQMQDMTFQVYLLTVKQPDMFSKILSFGCILNLGLFFVFITRDYFNAARGVIGGTILFAIPVVIAKFLL